MKKNKIQNQNHQFSSLLAAFCLTFKPNKVLLKPKTCQINSKIRFLTPFKPNIVLSDQPKTLVDPLWHSLNQIANLPQIL